MSRKIREPIYSRSSRLIDDEMTDEIAKVGGRKENNEASQAFIDIFALV